MNVYVIYTGSTFNLKKQLTQTIRLCVICDLDSPKPFAGLISSRTTEGGLKTKLSSSKPSLTAFQPLMTTAGKFPKNIPMISPYFSRSLFHVICGRVLSI